jgi:heat-inducible transcriptional repressor
VEVTPVLDERKSAILRAIVQEYIATGQPVGSSHVAGGHDLKVSPATVRNEMAVLEQEGYVTQPHTSAGRIPTDKGYRFFVDHMTQPGRLEPAVSQQVGAFFDHAHGRLEALLHQTTNLLAQITHHAGVIVGPRAERATVRSVQVVGLSSHHAMVVVVLSSGSVETRQIELVHEMSELRLSAASSHLAASMVGRTLDGRVELQSTGDLELDTTCATAVAAIAESASEQPVFVGGQASMARAFDAVDTVREVLLTLEQQYVVVSLVRDIMSSGLSVAIGAEHGVEPLAACSVVIAPVMVEGEQVGTVGVLGPTRMDYPQALATVEVVSERLGRHLGEGGGARG